MTSLSHRLAAVWFADVVGYTALSEENEGEAVRLVHAFQRVAREVVERHGGRVVKFLGDGALAEFPSTDMAVRSAAALIDRFRTIAADDGLASGELRVGVHVGDVVATEDGDLYGDGVNVASRIQAAGEPGEVWVSEDVRRQLRQRPEFRFESRGERELKGLRRPLAMHVVEVTDAETWESPVAGQRSGRRKGPPRWAGNLPRPARTGVAVAVVLLLALGAALVTGILPWGGTPGLEASDSSIAVLPFKDMSAAGDQEYFADGMTEEILNALAQVPDLRVAARTSSFAYKGREVDIREVARDLGVATVLEGSVRKEGDQLRITAQLIKASDGYHLWSESYDRKLESVFAVQEEIAEAIAKELKGSLGLAGGEVLVRHRTGDMGAYELYLEARGQVRRRGEGVERAIALYEQALERDPAFAPAWAGLAEAWSIAPYYHVGVDSTYWAESLDQAVEAAEKALELDPEIVSARVALGNAHRDRWEWREAERSYGEALDLAPDDPEANQQYAEFLDGVGRVKEAIPYAQRAAELDPLAAIRHNVLGYTLTLAGEYDDALVALRRSYAIDPSLQFTRRNIVVALLHRGRYREADEAMEEQGFPRDFGRRRMARALAAGDRAGAAEVVRTDSILRTDFVANALVGDREGVIASLRGALDSGAYGGPFGPPNYLWDPVLDPYRNDPQFQELLRSRHLEPRR